MNSKLKVLIVEDVATDAELALRELERRGVACIARRVETEDDFRRQLDEFAPDIILCDFSLPQFDGMTALLIAREKRPDTPFVFVSGTIGEERAIECLKRGATDYVLKTNLARLAPAVTRALEEAAGRRLRREQEEKIARMSRVLAVLSAINSTIVRVKSRGELFSEVCRIAVEHGKFKMASVGMAAGSDEIRPVAWHGVESAFSERIKITGAANEGCGCDAAAIPLSENIPFICNDTATAPAATPWREQALCRGYQACAVFPLVVGERIAGTLNLCASEPGFFDQGEINLLTELAGNISFALDHIEKQERLDYLAFYDDLTGLPNRTLFIDRLNQMLPASMYHNKLVGVLLLDISRFKLVNDTLGHHVGDALIAEVARRLRTVLRRDDTISRTGIDNFAIVLNRVADEADIHKTVTEKIFQCFSRQFVLHGQELWVSANMGIAIFPGDGNDGATLMKNAEVALGNARDSTSNYLFYSPEMNARVSETLALENRLHMALENREFILHYQPKVRLDGGRICGVEALIRWHDPHEGLVPPVRFIPILEQTGMIRDVGRWVLETATRQSRQWKKKGCPPVKVAVNVSPVQLAHEGFVEDVKSALNGTRAEGWGIELEITESVIMRDVHKNREKLELVRAMGVEISIDDFGTGYSSLSYLSHLPISSLKIDRAFIMDLPGNANNMTIVSAMISLAHALKLKVVAEGVETEEQVNILRLLKCDEMQGYVFSKPLPHQQIEQMLMENRSLG